MLPCRRCISPRPLMAAHLLSEVGPVAGAVGWTYTASRLRARLPGRALRGRPNRGRRAGRGRPRRSAPGGAAGGASRRCCRRLEARRPRIGGPGGPDAPAERHDGRRASLTRARSRGPSADDDASPDEEMPRVVFTRRRLLASVLFVVSDGRVPVLRAARAAGSQGDVEPDPARQRLVAGLARPCSRCCSFLGYIALFRRRVRPRQVADRLARELRDHDGRAGGDAAVRAGRRRRDRADRLGAAPVGDGAAGGRLPDGRVPGPALRRLHGDARDRRARARTSGCSRVGGSFALTVVPAIFGAS